MTVTQKAIVPKGRKLTIDVSEMPEGAEVEVTVRSVPSAQSRHAAAAALKAAFDALDRSDLPGASRDELDAELDAERASWET